MNDDQLMSGLWEVVDRLLGAVEKYGAEAVVRGWVASGDTPSLHVVMAREEFRASVLRLVRAWRDAPPVVEVPASVPVRGAATGGPSVTDKRDGLLRWLRDEFAWSDLRSEDSYTALRAASQLRNGLDALRTYGGAAEAAEVLRQHGMSPAEVS